MLVFLAVVLMATFLFVSLFCTSFGSEMIEHSSGSSCHVMGSGSADCPLTISGHIGQWLNNLAGIPKASVFLNMLLILIVLSRFNPLCGHGSSCLGPPMPLERYLCSTDMECQANARLHKVFANGIVHKQFYTS